MARADPALCLEDDGVLRLVEVKDGEVDANGKAG